MLLSHAVPLMSVCPSDSSSVETELLKKHKCLRFLDSETNTAKDSNNFKTFSPPPSAPGHTFPYLVPCIHRTASFPLFYEGHMACDGSLVDIFWFSHPRSHCSHSSWAQAQKSWCCVSQVQLGGSSQPLTQTSVMAQGCWWPRHFYYQSVLYRMSSWKISPFWAGKKKKITLLYGCPCCNNEIREGQRSS